MDTEYAPGSTDTESSGEADRTEHREARFEKMDMDPEALVDKDYRVLDVVPNEIEDEEDEIPNRVKSEEELKDEDMKKEEPMLCPKCNHPNPSYAKLCIKCGWDVEKKVETDAKDVAKFQDAIVKKPVSGVVEK
jgi:ribosomal protein L40E